MLMVNWFLSQEKSLLLIYCAGRTGKNCETQGVATKKKSEVEALQGVLSLKSPAGCVIKSLFPFLSMHQAIDITLIEL